MPHHRRQRQRATEAQYPKSHRLAGVSPAQTTSLPAPLPTTARSSRCTLPRPSFPLLSPACLLLSAYKYIPWHLQALWLWNLGHVTQSTSIQRCQIASKLHQPTCRRVIGHATGLARITTVSNSHSTKPALWIPFCWRHVQLHHWKRGHAVVLHPLAGYSMSPSRDALRPDWLAQ